MGEDEVAPPRAPMKVRKKKLQRKKVPTRPEQWNRATARWDNGPRKDRSGKIQPENNRNRGKLAADEKRRCPRRPARGVNLRLKTQKKGLEGKKLENKENPLARRLD